MQRLVTPLVFAFAAALVAAAAMLVFGDPAKESRDFLAILVLTPALSAAASSALISRTAGAAGYRMGFVRGALVGLASLLVFSATMAVLGCPAGSWFDCLLKSLVIFGFVMGVPVVVMSGLVGMLLDEIYAP